MRIDKVKVYKFDELSEEAQKRVIEQFTNVNINYDWWKYVYEDAAQVGLKITGFDIDRGAYCRGVFTLDAENVANKIIDQHGTDWSTYKTASKFLVEHAKANASVVEKLKTEFQRSIFEDYRIILQKEYEHLTNSEAVIEAIRTNEYEFKEDGTWY